MLPLRRRSPSAVRFCTKRGQALRRHLSDGQCHPQFRMRVNAGLSGSLTDRQPLPFAHVAHVLVRIELCVFMRPFPRGALCVVMRVNAVVFVVATARHQVSQLVGEFEPNHPEPGRHQNDSRQQRGF